MSDEIRSLTVVVTEDGSTGRVTAVGTGSGAGVAAAATAHAGRANRAVSVTIQERKVP